MVLGMYGIRSHGYCRAGGARNADEDDCGRVSTSRRGHRGHRDAPRFYPIYEDPIDVKGGSCSNPDLHRRSRNDGSAREATTVAADSRHTRYSGRRPD